MSGKYRIEFGRVKSFMKMATPRILPSYLKRWYSKRIDERRDRDFVRQWYLLYGLREKGALLNPEPDKLSKLLPPNDRSWMDPFIWRQGDAYFVFCEEWAFGDPHAHISVLHLDG